MKMLHTWQRRTLAAVLAGTADRCGSLYDSTGC